MKVKTTEPVQFDGKDLEIGSVIEVSISAGNQMIASGSAEQVGKAKRDGEADAEAAASAAAGQGVK
jgi:hypothetical protein